MNFDKNIEFEYFKYNKNDDQFDKNDGQFDKNDVRIIDTRQDLYNITLEQALGVEIFIPVSCWCSWFQKQALSPIFSIHMGMLHSADYEACGTR